MSEPTSNLPANAVDPDLEVGQQVGEYVVDGKLGQGAFGTVFRAVHPVIGKQVAVKVLARKFSVDPEMVSRFQAEAKAVNQIRHRHIIDIFSFSTLPDGRHYYVMEYLDGETLDALLERQGRLALRDALPILRGVGRALDAAHAKGIAHRDLKAENVFLATDPDGGVFPKLLDFGIAKLMAPEDGLKHKTRTGTPVGTPYYMSPEQCRGRDVDHRTDIYAFGVLAYLLLAGAYPHDADDYMSILMRQISVEPELPSSLAPDLPAGIDEAVMWLLAKDPADRPANLKTAVAAFEAAAEQAGISVGHTANWDVQSGPVEPTKSATPPALKTATKPSNPWASAPTVHPGSGGHPLASASSTAVVEQTAPPKKSSRTFVIATALAMLATGVIVVLVVAPWASKPEPVVETAKQAEVPPPPVPQPEPQPPAPQPPAPAPATAVIIHVAGVPEGTEVFAGGMAVGVAPGPVELPRDSAPMVLTFKLDGYIPLSKMVTPDRDQQLDVKLKKKPRAPNRDDLIDPFKRR